MDLQYRGKTRHPNRDTAAGQRFPTYQPGTLSTSVVLRKYEDEWSRVKRLTHEVCESRLLDDQTDMYSVYCTRRKSTDDEKSRHPNRVMVVQSEFFQVSFKVEFLGTVFVSS